MRITYLHQYFITPDMSGGTRSYEMARRLVKVGHEVHMITSDQKGAGRPYTSFEDGIKITWIPVEYSNDLSYARRMKAFLYFAIRSSQIALRDQTDLVFATSTPLTIVLPGVLAKWRSRAPMVFEVRDLWPELPIAMGALKNPLFKFIAERLERFAYRSSEQVIALSPEMKEGVAATGYPEEKITIVPNSSDLERFQVNSSEGNEFRSNVEWLGDRPLITYTGTIGAINGVGWLADVAAAMHDLNPEVRFLVVGNGRDAEEVRKYAERIGVLNRNFFMRRSVPKNEIPGILSAADICTSLFIDLEAMWANSANKFFDALAAGKPVAINYAGWQSELLRDNNAGLVLEPSDIQGAAHALNDALANPEWLSSTGANAARLAIEQFDRDKLFKRFEAVLHTAVGKEA